MTMKFLIFTLLLSVANGSVYFEDTFSDGDKWEKRWVQSEHHDDDKAGKFVLSAGKFHGDPEQDKGLQTSQDARFYALSCKFNSPASTLEKPLVVQFTVKHEQDIDCGGGYVKLFGSNLDQSDLHGETDYLFMLGPDICGPSNKKIHAIFNYKGKNVLINKELRCKDDVMTHLYTFIIDAVAGKLTILVDNEEVHSGPIEESHDALPPKQIEDPEAKKPEDWDDRKTIADESDVKPDDWDQPEHIPDPEATKPDDWEDETDGEWEAPMIDNPDYKGEWKPKQIDNPKYSGIWVHPKIDNPEYDAEEAAKLCKFDNINFIGIDLWQVKSGTIFDNFIITDDISEAKEHAAKYFDKTVEPEKKMKEEQDAEREKLKKETELPDKADGLDDDEEEEEEEEEDDDYDQGKEDSTKDEL